MGTQLVEIREALRQAMDEEMQRDPTVFILGEEVAEYNGAYKITKGMLDKWALVAYSTLRSQNWGLQGWPSVLP